jgi:hypothetical protein
MMPDITSVAGESTASGGPLWTSVNNIGRRKRGSSYMMIFGNAVAREKVELYRT